jgi:hypothetical protein
MQRSRIVRLGGANCVMLFASLRKVAKIKVSAIICGVNESGLNG